MNSQLSFCTDSEARKWLDQGKEEEDTGIKYTNPQVKITLEQDDASTSEEADSVNVLISSSSGSEMKKCLNPREEGSGRGAEPTGFNEPQIEATLEGDGTSTSDSANQQLPLGKG